MKKLILLCLLVLGFSVAVLAKDGPFPMYQAAGRWVVPGGSGVSIDIKVGAKVKRGTAVMVGVYVRNSAGKLQSYGTTAHKLSSPTLKVNLYDKKGKAGRLELKAVYSETPVTTGKRPFKLDMTLFIDQGEKVEEASRLQLDRPIIP